ncbi:unnamed protein product, partial [Mesorhabditis belari]|uniref:Uncharacterized protein n=1 Tax=Mesorhabditis belari TaxID=2138241 RepID=A0AAF3EJX7_9BILA
MAVILPEAGIEKADRVWNDTDPPSSSSSSNGSSSPKSSSPIPTKKRVKIQQENNSETFFIRWICAFFRVWAHFIARHAVKVIIACSILSLIGAIKLATTPNENEIAGWTPYGARSLSELEVSREFFGNKEQIISVMLILLAKDGGSMLTTERMNEIKRIEDFVAKNFTMFNKETGKWENFRKFCYSFCQLNDPLIHFANGFIMQEDLRLRGEPLNDRIELSYPVTSMYGRTFNVQPSFFGLDFFNNNTSPIANTTELARPRIVNLKSLKMAALHFRGERAHGWTLNDVKTYELAVTHYFKNEFHSDEVTVLTLSTSYVEAEVVRAGYKMLPIFIIGFGIMLAISSLTTFISAAYMQQLTIHKFSLALFACITPFMACGTALGFLFIFGVRFGSILCISPFLVLAIGVDDAYLMIHAWQRVSKRLRSHPVDDDSPGYRLAEVLTDTGPAIIISALTNILADTVGTFTGCPEITLLSYGNMACIGVDFLYQISFYAAIMALAGRFEIGDEQQKKNKLSIEIGDENSVDICHGECCPKVSEGFHDAVKTQFNAFLDGYVNLVNNRLFDTAVFIAWAAYIVLCIYGISNIKVNISSKKLFAGDSDLQIMEDLRYKHVYPYYVIVQVFVNNPGNLSDPKRLERLNTFVSEFEQLPGAWGNVSTNYFIRDFMEFEEINREMDGEEGDFKTNFDPNDLPQFIEWTEYEFWRGFIRLSNDKNNNTHLDRFFFTTAFHGKEFLAWKTRSIAMHQWRDVVDKYNHEFNSTVFYDEGIYIDFMDNMATDTWQSAAGTLSCMALICFIFMYDFFTVVVSTAAIASVMAGILGINALLGMELDPIVMASLAAISTNLCVVALLFADIYTSRVFVRIMQASANKPTVHLPPGASGASWAGDLAPIVTNLRACTDMACLVRKEYRMMSDYERQRFHGAVNTLKQSGTYDQIAKMHSQMSQSGGAHSGPAFLAWHREFIKEVEFELRRIDPDIYIPYWDSALESRLPRPQDSSFFSAELMGTGSGNVVEGPFANWRTIENQPLRRAAGGSGNPFTDRDINYILQQPTITNVLAFSAAQERCPYRPDFNCLEYTHGNVHLWVGGHMFDQMTSANDPIFYLHHSNIDGLSNKYTDELYQYAPRPTCTSVNPGCGSRFLFCDVSHGAPRCAAKIRVGGSCQGFVRGEDSCYNGVCWQGVCRPGAVATTTVAPTITVRPSLPVPNVVDCWNENQCCQAWAARGECTTNRGYMQDFCKASCNICRPNPPIRDDCSDRHPTCGSWTSTGECTKNPDWMTENCRRSCNRCQQTRAQACSRGQTSVTQAPREQCENSPGCFNEYACCPHWANQGQCRSNPSFMMCNCRVSCGMCFPTDYPYGACVDYHRDCQAWTRSGECRKNPWMEENCRSSCQTCFAQWDLRSMCGSTANAGIISGSRGASFASRTAPATAMRARPRARPRARIAPRLIAGNRQAAQTRQVPRAGWGGWDDSWNGNFDMGNVGWGFGGWGRRRRDTQQFNNTI